MSKIQIIINPASGDDQTVPPILNKVLGKGIDWDISITQHKGDAERFTAEAVAAGVDIVAVCGGDGTVSVVANVLAGGDVPLAILPGGTGNSIARSLQIPLDLAESAALLQPGFRLRTIDLGRSNDHTFMLRADIGFTAVAGANTTREEKDALGKWAYALSGIQHLDLLTPIPYQLTLDGEEKEVQGVICAVINMGAVEFGHRPMVEGIRPDDGLLDILVLERNDIVALTQAASSIVFGNEAPLQHWQVKTAVIHPNPPQAMLADGEPIQKTPAHIQIVPHALKVIVPAVNNHL
jgi:YegS/Rv2252/BmrU family lipid kinase